MALFSHHNPEAIARALALTGGGVRGLFTAAVLSRLEHHLGLDLSKQFDVIVGTSVGGIIALGLACGISAHRISEHICRNARGIFGSPTCLNAWGLRATRHRPDQLRECISSILGPAGGTMIRDLNRNIVIPSVDARDNRVVYFSNVERIGSTVCLNASLTDVALATSAAPTYFPPHPIGDRIFLDGGIASNNPDVEALGFCLAVLLRPLQSLLLLSVGTGKAPYIVSRGDRMDGGGIKWLAKYKILDRLMSLQEAKSSELVLGLLGDRYMRIDTIFDKEIELDDCREDVLNLLLRHAEMIVTEKWNSGSRGIAYFVR